MSRAGVMLRKPTTKTPVVKKPAAAAPTAVTHEAVAKRAYEIWIRKGRPQGQCQQNWLEAEKELRAAPALTR